LFRALLLRMISVARMFTTAALALSAMSAMFGRNRAGSGDALGAGGMLRSRSLRWAGTTWEASPSDAEAGATGP
jgi:hypothetical protein